MRKGFIGEVAGGRARDSAAAGGDSNYARRGVLFMPPIEVTMLLTEGDVENAERIRETTDAPNNAQAVSIALALTRFVVDEIQRQKRLLLERPDGTLEKVSMDELDRVAKQHWGDSDRGSAS